MFPYSKSSVHHDLYLYGLYVCHLMHKNCQDPPALKNMQIQGTTRILVFGSCSYCSMPGTGQLGQGGFSHRNWFLKRPTNMGFRWNQCRLSEDLAWGYDDYWRAMLSGLSVPTRARSPHLVPPTTVRLTHVPLVLQGHALMQVSYCIIITCHSSRSYGHLPVTSTFNPIYRMYNPIYNHL